MQYQSLCHILNFQLLQGFCKYILYKTTTPSNHCIYNHTVKTTQYSYKKQRKTYSFYSILGSTTSKKKHVLFRLHHRFHPRNGDFDPHLIAIVFLIPFLFDACLFLFKKTYSSHIESTRQNAIFCMYA